jgi:hypothetical protein
MNRPEEALQRTVVDYLWIAAPPELFWFAVPNQRGTRTKAEMGVLKALGVRAGVPDLCFLWAGRFLGIELKATSGVLTDAQEKAWMDIEAAGGSYAACRSLDQVVDRLKAFGVPLRAEPSPLRPVPPIAISTGERARHDRR